MGTRGPIGDSRTGTEATPERSTLSLHPFGSQTIGKELNLGVRPGLRGFSPLGLHQEIPVEKIAQPASVFAGWCEF
ncbi:hypothetical protein JTE90_010992 [Oedothorax gibbosus]|uniref:Uncharacterized protein n=1 Tax=Oedothorax gibbosus TaxID=931172 RepID=A0AAV6VE95_9ARAC|nr:hypothetical protein JTE90_010992 [Oedothorax gibbosus]